VAISDFSCRAGASNLHEGHHLPGTKPWKSKLFQASAIFPSLTLGMVIPWNINGLV
jgi:hypothetical protein